MRKVFLLVCLLLPTLLAAQVKVGDILCVQDNDTVMVHPENYTSGGIGVVFYVDDNTVGRSIRNCSSHKPIGPTNTCFLGA